MRNLMEVQVWAISLIVKGEQQWKLQSLTFISGNLAGKGTINSRLLRIDYWNIEGHGYSIRIIY
jgi:hypothetical protein